MKKLLLSATCLLICGAAAALAQTQDSGWEISGTIVDESGSPLPEAEFARYFMLEDGKFTAYQGLKTDAEGKFAGTIQPYKLPMTYIAFDKDQKLGASVVVTEESVESPLRVVLAPLAELSFQTEIEAGYEPTGMSTSLGCPDTNTVVILSYDPGPFRLPAGDYELRFFSLELKQFRKQFTAAAGEKVDVGTCSLELTPISKNIGKPAMPLEFTEARGVPPNFTLDDLKGKWVLLEFWGYW